MNLNYPKNRFFNQSKGKVVLAGAGPGDPELITLKTVRHLNRADIVLVDDLANAAIVNEHAPQARMIPVGKRAGSAGSTPQNLINRMLVDLATEGNYVVRLKGGDSSLYSNIDDELKALLNEGIEVEVVPGITTALGVAAILGMPLTARGLSQGLRLLTYHREEAISGNSWESLATTDDTLVFYMSAKNCYSLCQKLLSAGKAGDTPILLAEKVSTPSQRFRISTIANCHEDWADLPIATPALLVIGMVVSNIHIFLPQIRVGKIKKTGNPSAGLTAEIILETLQA